jgi:hypothetical protein
LWDAEPELEQEHWKPIEPGWVQPVRQNSGMLPSNIFDDFAELFIDCVELSVALSQQRIMLRYWRSTSSTRGRRSRLSLRFLCHCSSD